VVSGCEVTGASYPFSVGDGGHGAPGIGGTAELLVVLDSEIQGGNGEPATSAGPGGRGGAAVDLQGEALLVRSKLAGGNPGLSHAYPLGAPPSFCFSFYQPAPSGDAALATKVVAWGSAGIGGAPGEWLDCQGLLMGYGEPGDDLPVNPPAFLRGDPVVSIGGSLTLDLVGGGQGVLYASLAGWSPSIDVPALGPHYLGSSPVLVFQGLWPDPGLALPIPPASSLIGGQPVFQALKGTTLTNPIQVLLAP